MSVYQSTDFSPNGYGIDMSTDKAISCIVHGSIIDAYKIIVYKLDNTTLYDSTKITLGTPIYDKDILNITITGGTITYKGQIKYTITTYSGANSAVSREIPFYNSTTPTATLSITSPVIAKKTTLTTTYTQAESVPVEWYQYFLYDSTGAKILQQSKEIYTQKLQYTFDGLIDENSYKAKCIIHNIYGQVADSGLISFTVDYSQPNINITPTTEVLSDLSAIKTTFGNAFQNIGTSTGTINYIDNYLTVANVGLELVNSSSTVYWDIDIPASFTTTLDWEYNGSGSVNIAKYEDGSGNYYLISYDGTKFVLDLNGTIVNGSPVTLNSNVYVLGILPQSLYIFQNNILIDYVKGWWV